MTNPTPTDGGPAFAKPASYISVPCDSRDGPSAYADKVDDGHDGMSLRDYFAGLAMAALLSTADRPGSADDLAAYAYGNADAMLAQREKGAAK